VANHGALQQGEPKHGAEQDAWEMQWIADGLAGPAAMARADDGHHWL
jgi:hypothetical protein